MKDKNRDSYERLIHISKAITDIEVFAVKKEKIDFLNNNLLSSAILFQFSIIGEAVVFIENNILEKYPYPWYKVRAFRNLISHEYFSIELSAVWEIIKKDLPELKIMINTILNNEFKDLT
ncbi:MAG: DUF86 domain-containing protein [Bacteroidales bacterium]|nr:DUF86 domain-containing protein [Bacteroidales bacterium]